MHLWLSTQLLSETYLILKRIQHNIIINDTDLHVKHLLFSSHFNETLIFSADFQKLSNFMKIRQAGPKSFHVDNVNDNIYFIKWSVRAANTVI